MLFDLKSSKDIPGWRLTIYIATWCECCYLFILRLFYYILTMHKTHKNDLGLITFQRKLSIQLLVGVAVKEQKRNCFEKLPWERQMNEEVKTETKPTDQTCDLKSFAIAGFRFLWMVARDFYALLYKNKRKQKLKSRNQDLNSFTFRLSAIFYALSCFISCVIEMWNVNWCTEEIEENEEKRQRKKSIFVLLLLVPSRSNLSFKMFTGASSIGIAWFPFA